MFQSCSLVLFGIEQYSVRADTAGGSRRRIYVLGFDYYGVASETFPDKEGIAHYFYYVSSTLYEPKRKLNLFDILDLVICGHMHLIPSGNE